MTKEPKEKSDVYHVSYFLWGLLPFYWRNLAIGDVVSKPCPVSDGDRSSNSLTKVEVRAKHEVIFTHIESNYLGADRTVTLAEGTEIKLPVPTIQLIFSYMEKIIV